MPPPTSAPSPYRVQAAMRAIAEARDKLLTTDPDITSDERLYLDCLDGESGDAFEVLDRVVRSSIEATDLAEQAGNRARELIARRERFERRASAMRALALMIVNELDVRRVERADFTLGVNPGSPHVVITDLTKLGPRHLRTIPARVEPDKSTLLRDLKGLPPGEHIDGAELSNPQPYLTVKKS